MTRILVCGGRDYADREALWEFLDNYSPPAITAIISGMARGADTLAAEWAITYGVVLRPFPANWREHGKAAGAIRNQQMIDEGMPDVVVAFPGGVGTADMVRRARKAKIHVVEGPCA